MLVSRPFEAQRPVKLFLCVNTSCSSVLRVVLLHKEEPFLGRRQAMDCYEALSEQQVELAQQLKSLVAALVQVWVFCPSVRVCVSHPFVPQALQRTRSGAFTTFT